MKKVYVIKCYSILEEDGTKVKGFLCKNEKDDVYPSYMLENIEELESPEKTVNEAIQFESEQTCQNYLVMLVQNKKLECSRYIYYSIRSYFIA